MAKRKAQNRTRWIRSRALRVRPSLEILDDRVLLSGTNPIVTENQLPGTLYIPGTQTSWLVPQGQADTSLQGFTTDISVDVGSTVSFKVTDTTLDPYSIDIYRIGYYGGDGARLVTTIPSSQISPQNQPAPIRNAATGEVDAGNWAVSASWAVPSTAVSGVYLADLVDARTGGMNMIVFVVRNDASQSQILFQTADSTWQAYNEWGGANKAPGASLYEGNGPSSYQGAAYAVSYNRPLDNYNGNGESSFHDEFFWAEFPMVEWLEQNGYDVSYFTDVDADRSGSLIENHQIWMDAGHDEYWSGNEFNNVMAARDAKTNPVDLAFFSGNTAFWKTYYSTSINGAGPSTQYRTLVCYKETHLNNGAGVAPNQVDTINPNVWTGTWADPRFSPPFDGGIGQNELTGTFFTVNQGTDPTGTPITVPSTDDNLPIWRNTAVATGKSSIGGQVLGYEWDPDVNNAFRPVGEIDMSSTTQTGSQMQVMNDYGNTFSGTTATHSLTEYRASSRALVFSAGTVQWSWGLSGDGYSTDNLPDPDPNMQQATVNLLADMGAQPGTLQANLVPATQTALSSAPPTTAITGPLPGALLPSGTPVTIKGTASAASGAFVVAVEVSTDGGKTWNPATGTTSWSYTWTPGAPGSVTILSRAVDDTVNLGNPSTGVPVTVTLPSGPLSIWSNSVTPSIPDSGPDNPVELGVKFSSDISGYITGIRFYKSSANTGTHVGNLWSSTGQLLDTATFSSETASGWQQVNFATPVQITAGTIYVASYHTNVGHYSDDLGYFAGQSANDGPLHGLEDEAGSRDGVYVYGSGGFPSNISPSSDNYWVDVVFATSANLPPTVASETPAPNAEGVPTNTTVTATFSEGVQSGTINFTLTSSSGPVATTLSYNSSTNTATWTPTVALNPATNYTATVSGATDASGHTMSGTVSWSFSTAGLYTLWNSSVTPSVASANDPNAVNLGVKFQSDVAGYITGIRFYKGPSNTGTHIGYLWSSTGALLTSATFTNETASGWQQVNFPNPVQITANTVYVASYFAPAGGYAVDDNYFATAGYDNAPLHALKDGVSGGDGVYGYGSSGTFPTGSYQSDNYWVDVVLNTNQATQLNVSAPTSATAGGTFSVTVTAQNGSNQTVTGYTGTVHFTSTDVQAGLPANYTFTAADAGVHIFTGLTLKTAGSRTVTATDTGTSSITGSATVAVSPAAASTLVVTAPASVTTGAAFNVTVTAKDPYGNTATSYTGTAHFTSSDSSAVLPANYTFTTGTSADNGVHIFSGVTLNTTGSQTITATDTSTSSITGSATVTVASAAQVTHLNVSAPTSATAGTPFSVTVTAQNGSNSTVTGYTGTVHFTSTDVQAGLPANYTFTAADNGVHTFTGLGLILKTAGSQTVTATDTVTSSITGSATVAVSPAAASTLVETAPASVTTGAPFSVTVTAKDPYGNTATSYTGTVQLTSSDSSAVLPASHTFTAANAGVYTFTGVTLKVVASQTVTATDTVTSSITGKATVTVASATIWSSSATPTTPDSGPDSAVTLGVKFSSTISGMITGIRFYKGSGNTGTHVGSLWSSTGTLLDTATFTNETASGWQQVNFSSPVAITAGTTYVASYFTSVGHYADDQNYFATSGVVNAPLQALADGVSGSDGVYAYGSTSTFPTNGWNASNYWVDVVFTADPPPSGSKASAVVAAPSAATTPAVVTPSTTAVVTTPSPTKTQKKSDPVLEQVSSSSGSVAAGSTFLSTVLDNGQNGQAATWDKFFVSKVDLPAGVKLLVQVSTGNTPTPDSTWSPWTAVNHGNAVPKANARYLQYRVSLNIPSGQTVRLPVGFDIDVTSVANTKAHESKGTDRVGSLPTASAPVLTGIPGMSPTKPSVSPDVYDAGQGMTWQSLSWTTASLPSGATMVLEVSTGDTSTPDRTWSAWTAVANGGDIPVPGRYLQYRVRVLAATSSLTTVPVKISLISNTIGTPTNYYPGENLKGVIRNPE